VLWLLLLEAAAAMLQELLALVHCLMLAGLLGQVAILAQSQDPAECHVSTVTHM
jgi:hypothetical protein